MSEYNQEQFENERLLAEELDFVENYLADTSYAVAGRVCNGIGAGWFPAKLRDFVSKLNPSLVVVANNHDLGYYYGTGTGGDFHAINKAFAINGEKMAVHRYEWYDPRRYWVCWQAQKFAAMCEAFGWPAYVMAMSDRKKSEVANV